MSISIKKLEFISPFSRYSILIIVYKILGMLMGGNMEKKSTIVKESRPQVVDWVWVIIRSINSASGLMQASAGSLEGFSTLGPAGLRLEHPAGCPWMLASSPLHR